MLLANRRHSIYTILTTLMLLVLPGIVSAQQAAGITPDKATRITAPVTLTVQSGSNYIRFEEEYLPAVVTYIPSAPFGTIPVALVMGDTIEAERVFADCRTTWRWTIEEAESVIAEIKAHESALIGVVPYTCQTTYSDTTAVACDSLLWKGEWRYASGDYEYVTINTAGCDSVVTLHLTINHPTIGEETFVECDSLFWNGQWRRESGDYEYHTTNIAGCDSTAILHLTIHHPVSVTLKDTAVCETVTGYEYVWSDPIKGDTTIRKAGTYTRHFKTAFGCDSAVTQTVRFLDMTQGETTITAYDSYTTNIGQTYVTSWENGGPIDYYTNAAGCDSIVNIHLYIRHLQVKDTFPLTVCATELPLQWYGKSCTESGRYTTDTIEGISVNGVYRDTVYTMDLTVLPVSSGETTATACESFEWHGTTYTQSGDYDHTLVGANIHGCDSIVTLHLTIHHPSAGEETATACESFTWHGTTYSESGDYTFHTTNVAGCDSTATLHLTISKPTSGEETQSACNSFTWNGTTYSESGDYTFHTTNVAGCDSTATLHLTINKPTFGEETRSACNSFTWNGQTYSISGDYVFQTTNIAGCDSTVTLHLTINNCSMNYDTVYFCTGLNTGHEEIIDATLIRRYIPYVYESPAEWDYMENVIIASEHDRMQVDLKRAEQNLYEHYQDGLTPVKNIAWSYRPDGETAYIALEVTDEPQWITTGTVVVTIRFVCGQVYTSDFETDVTTAGDERLEGNGRKVLENGQIVIIRGGLKYSILGTRLE